MLYPARDGTFAQGWNYCCAGMANPGDRGKEFDEGHAACRQLPCIDRIPFNMQKAAPDRG